ncbi:Cell cycle checkpoint protein rad17 [Pleurotus pulmonarius]|nr:Cell cycle checkpoint protein rad17 [Pleurotus pulmonarius]
MSAKLTQSKKPPKKRNVLQFNTQPAPPTRRVNPLTAFSSQPATPSTSQPKSTMPPPSQTQSKNAKGKGKAVPLVSKRDVPVDSLWVDIYEPASEAELAVHPKKVEEVRRWFSEAFEGGPSGKLRKYRKILALSGPAGAAKTATLRVLSREMGFSITEWRSSFEDRYLADGGDDDYETLFTKFQNFMSRATTCTNSLFPSNGAEQQVILLEDLPNILHQDTQAKFHALLESLVDLPRSTPIVMILSDAGVRGETGVEEGSSWRRNTSSAVDVRSAIPKSLLTGPYVTHIAFNRIAPTLMRKALHAMLSTHFAGSPAAPPSKEALDLIVESVNGDIRSAIMALQFACVVEAPVSKKGRTKAPRGTSTRAMLEVITKRENSLVLFHLLGKILYNKRKGDPPNASASAKDIQREKDADLKIKDPPRLPPFLQEHDRAASRVDVDMLYADSPIDASLLSLYIHQNYPQFCDDVDECADIAEWMSWVDWSGGEAWYQANPHRFHLLTLGTLHSLPSPVTRRSQKFYKPAYFDQLKGERDAGCAVTDVQGWLADGPHNHSTRALSKAVVATELGAVLKTRAAPRSHQLFTHMPFSYGNDRLQPLEEGDILSQHNHNDEGEWAERHAEGIRGGEGEDEEANLNGGWLEGDDIEEF